MYIYLSLTQIYGPWSQSPFGPKLKIGYNGGNIQPSYVEPEM